MPLLKKSLGSLAAVAALAPAQEAAAATIFSPFSNVPSVGTIDIDGNGSIDFNLNPQGALEGLLANNGTAANGFNPEIFPPGFSSVNSSFTFNQSQNISSVISPDPKYIGVRFDRAYSTSCWSVPSMWRGHRRIFDTEVSHV